MHLTAPRPYLTLSDLRILAPAQRHPQFAKAQRIVAAHCERLGIMRPNYADYTTMSPYLFPRTSLERLVAINLLMNLLYYVDDMYDRHHAQQSADPAALMVVFQQGIRAFQSGEAPTLRHPILEVCLELHRQFSPLTNPAWMARLITSLTNHLHSTLVDSSAVQHEGRLSMSAYLALRDHDSGMQPTIDLIEFAADCYLPEALRQHAYVRRMQMATARIGGLMNDLFSYAKEVIAHGSQFNLVAVMMDELDCSFDEAVHYIVSLLNVYIEDFQQAEAEMPVWLDADSRRLVQTYVLGLRDQVIASWHWQYSTNRYRSPMSPFPELRQML